MSNSISLAIADPVAARTARVLDQLFPSPRDVTIRLWDGTELPAASIPALTLVLKHPGALRRMLAPPIELALGEAFVYGDFDIEGDIFSFLPFFSSLAAHSFPAAKIAALAGRVLTLPNSGPARPDARGPARLRGALHSRERDRAAIQYHYDVGNNFYALWLDRAMQYSCGYFSAGSEDLDTAQERKMEYICRKLRLQPGERLLDIGCGW